MGQFPWTEDAGGVRASQRRTASFQISGICGYRDWTGRRCWKGKVPGRPGMFSGASWLREAPRSVRIDDGSVAKAGGALLARGRDVSQRRPAAALAADIF